MMKEHHAFTILELLIVVGIIAILAGIAMENFARASIRSKVTRVLSDHRTLRLGIESYRTDHNRLPRMASRNYGDPQFDQINGIPVSGVMSKVLSTPVAYVTNAYLFDPFMTNRPDAPLDERLYTYQDTQQYIVWNPDSTFWPQAVAYYGDWRLASVGPDQSFDHLFANSAQLPYDPTNGTISLGNIWTAPGINPERPGLPPIPDLLGAH